jgi:hypothetical protein
MNDVPGRLTFAQHRMRLVSSLVLFFGLLGTAALAVVPTQYTISEVTNRREALSDPGGAPPFNVTDYPSSLFSGSDTVAGSPFVSIQNGPTIPCGVTGAIFIFPDTPYVRWVLRKWFYLMATSGDYSRPADDFAIAPQIDPFNRATIVRGGECIGGKFTATGLPIGKYVVVAKVSPEYLDRLHSPTISYVPEPEGGAMRPEIGDSEGSTVRIPTDDWFYVAANVHFGEANQSAVIGPDDWTVFVHTSFDYKALLASHKGKRR